LGLTFPITTAIVVRHNIVLSINKQHYENKISDGPGGGHDSYRLRKGTEREC
jgi:hypothetical protein